ncbi:MAG: hypothetical protein HNEKOMLI_00260 [Sodalis sp. Psp]|nr:hypothetical protein [Sodalis sp. Psp]MCR3756757.1 hypothetical protein [Sodalis sp. Ppy]
MLSIQSDGNPIWSRPSPLPFSGQSTASTVVHSWVGEHFLFIDSFRYYKGLYTLIKTVRTVQCSIVLIGVGPMEEELKKLSIELGLKNIHFLGALSGTSKAALLNSCYGMVFQSYLRSEAFGISRC